MKDRYLTILNSVTSEIKIRKSRFIANAVPVSTVEEVQAVIEKIKKEYHDAGHNPFSYVLSDINSFRYYDDGEPSGSSGRPIYDAINKYDFKNIIVIVTRYFGGIKLGVGGLKRAYFESADSCLSICKIKEIIMTRLFEVKFDYSLISQVMQYIEKSKFKVKENNSAEKAILIVEVPLSRIDNFGTDLTEITGGKAIIKEVIP
jgi:uncharacterized YigZ family protein